MLSHAVLHSLTFNMAVLLRFIFYLVLQQYKFINMAAISWIKRKTITHEQRHVFKITLLEVGQRKRYKRVLHTLCLVLDVA